MSITSSFHLATSSLFLASAALALSQEASDNSDQQRIDVSFNYSTGDYGLASDTDVIVVLANPTLENEAGRFQVSLPYVWLDGPATIVGDVGDAGTSVREQGIGDISVTAVYKLPRPPEAVKIELGATVKFPTGDEDAGLGTGETDVSVQADFFKTWGGLTYFGTLGHQFLGRSEAFPLEDGFFAGGGIAAPVSADVTLGASVNFREPIIDGGDHAVEAMVFAMRQLNLRWRIQGYLLKGFTDASPSIGAGVMAGFRF